MNTKQNWLCTPIKNPTFLSVPWNDPQVTANRDVPHRFSKLDVPNPVHPYGEHPVTLMT